MSDAREVSVSYYRGRVAVITGAGSGIGRALALDLAARGARIALLDRDAGTVGETERQCKNAGIQVRADTVDVTDRPALASWAKSVLRQFGHIDLVICAAGVIHTGSLLTSEPGDVDRVINVNVLGVVSTVKLFLPHLASGGHIVTFSSGFGLVGAPLYTAYCASKFAVRGLSEALGLEMALGGHPVSVTCVIPGGNPHTDHAEGQLCGRRGRGCGHRRVQWAGRTDGSRSGGVRHLARRAAPAAAGAGRRRRAGRLGGGALSGQHLSVPGIFAAAADAPQEKQALV